MTDNLSLRSVTRFVAIGLPVFCWFLPPWLTGEFFLARDIAHYYHPLWLHAQQQWEVGQWPLWNSFENMGQPLAADMTTSLFYPGKLCFGLPFTYEQNFLLYLVVHYLWGAWGIYRLATHWGTSQEGAGFAAVAYTCSGHVLFQYCNPVYLVGAAWVPWSLKALFQLMRCGTWRAGWACGLCWACMVLGGDPQSAIHGILIGLGAVTYRLFVSRPTDRFEEARRLGCRLLGGVGAAVALAAVQLGPSLEWAGHTNRVVADNPASLWEWSMLPAEQRTWERLYRGTLAPAEPQTHRQVQYRFSIGPWRWIELLFPNISGQSFPVHRRWLHVLPAEGPAWSPSLYAGCLPFLLAWWQFRQVPRERAQHFVRILAIGAIGASLGWYGLGWVGWEVTSVVSVPTEVGRAHAVDAPVGGPYWFLTVLVPGYAVFRYPAKWWTFFALSSGLAAAWGWDGLCRRGPQLIESARRLSLASCGLWVVSVGCSGVLAEAWATIPPSRLWGPFDPLGASADLRGAFLHTALVAASAAVGLRYLPAPWRGSALLLLTAFDLCVAHAWQFPTAPVELFQRPPALLGQLALAPQPTTTTPPNITLDRAGDLYPSAWLQSRSPWRLEQVVRCDRDTLAPKYNLPYGIRVVHSSGSAISADWESLNHVMRRDPEVATQRASVALGVTHSLRPSAHGFQLKSQLPIPYLGIVHDVRPLAPERTEARASQLAAWLANDQPASPTALVDPGDMPAPMVPPPNTVRSSTAVGSRGSDREWALCRSYRPGHFTVQTQLVEPGLLVVAESPAPGWRVTELVDQQVTTHRIVQTNLVMQGVWLEPGRHDLGFEYRPASIRWGATISLTGWMMAIVCAGRSCWRAGWLSRRDHLRSIDKVD